MLTGKHKSVTAAHRSRAAGIHCGAYNLDLAASQPAKVVPYMDKIKDLLWHLYCFYASSSVRTAELCAIQKVLDTEQGGGKISE